MFDTSEKRREISKWFIGIFTCCILIYLGFRHISSIASAISWLIDLARPLQSAQFLHCSSMYPMSFFEQNLRKKTKLRKGARPLAIVLALVLVFGIFIGITVLVVPELIEAVKLLFRDCGRWT